jgi:hypothetical protein
MQSPRNAFVAAVPSAVRPEMAIPTLSSILNSFLWEEDSSEAARFKVASTTYSAFCAEKHNSFVSETANHSFF